MTNAIELFEKSKAGKWVNLSLASFTGKPVRKEVWESMDGKEIVGKLTREGKLIGYVVGTPELRSHYEGKGAKVWSWTDAAAMMQAKSSPLLDSDHGILGDVLSVFGEGCRVESAKYNITGENNG